MSLNRLLFSNCFIDAAYLSMKFYLLHFFFIQRRTRHSCVRGESERAARERVRVRELASERERKREMEGGEKERRGEEERPVRHDNRY